MKVALNRIILYVTDVEKLAQFYGKLFELALVEHIEGEWAVFQAGLCELALHRAGASHRGSSSSSMNVNSNPKLVMTVDRDLAALRAEFVANGVVMGEIKSYPGLRAHSATAAIPKATCFNSRTCRMCSPILGYSP